MSLPPVASGTCLGASGFSWGHCRFSSLADRSPQLAPMQWRPLSAPIADLLARPYGDSCRAPNLAASGFGPARLHLLASGPRARALR